jgi:nicotinate dehydrogenase subunit B
MSELDVTISRRAALSTGGALIVGFALGCTTATDAESVPLGPPRPRGLFAPRGREGMAPGANLPGSLRFTPMLDSWLRIDAHGITVFTGKAELGQGIMTALIQVAAEELAVEPGGITLVTADTARTPNEGYTAGSHSMQDSATAILNAAAQAREILIGVAARRFALADSELRAEHGAVVARDGRRIAYADLVSDQTLHVRARPHSRLGNPARRRVMGVSVPRVDIPAKVFGEAAFVQDLRLEGMVHARIVRPPSYGARLVAVDTDGVRKLPGVLHVVRDGSYLAVVARREYQAVVAREALERAAHWEEMPSLPEQSRLFSDLASWPSRDVPVAERHGTAAAAGRSAVRPIEAEYRRGYLMHGSIGPSCGVALFENGALTVWTHSQGVYPLRGALCELLALPVQKVRCIQVEGSGCYGHNGADDAAADAALIARQVPGRPVRVQWMRADEHAWEPYGPAMLARVRGSLDDAGNVASWEYDVWSNTHSTRPGGARELMPAWYRAPALSPPQPRPIPMPEGGGDRNSLPLYRIPNLRVDYHFVPKMPLRVSALRSLGADLNVFAIESFMDELALHARLDPIELRLRHLEDPRAADVVRAAADLFGWNRYRRAVGRGRGFAFARYKNLAAYAAIAVEASVDRKHGTPRILRVAAAVDSGEAVNPDGIRNQIEGGIVQAMSWALLESVKFGRTRIESRDWDSYPILRFSAAPASVQVRVLNRPGQPFLGSGEAAQGPAAAAIANAIADAAGARVREMPLTAERIRAAMARAQGRSRAI